MSINLKVVILSHNRPEYLIESVQSVVNASKFLPKDVDLLIEVSDNSDNDECITVINKSFKEEVKIVSRIPVISPFKHFKNVISEADADYLVIFHDDDIMENNFLIDLYNLIIQDKSISSVAGNAYYIRSNRITKSTFLSRRLNFTTIHSLDELVNYYFRYDKQRIAPFPSYMYRVDYLQQVNLDKIDIGKHGDVALLLEVLNFGKIIWTHNIVMNYRLHGNNDSGIFSFIDNLNLYFYLKHEKKTTNVVALKNYHFQFWWTWYKEYIKNKNIFPYPGRIKIIKKFIFKNLILLLLFDNGYKRYMSKIKFNQMITKFNNILISLNHN
jgi:GT2 family glycosyltransferase